MKPYNFLMLLLSFPTVFIASYNVPNQLEMMRRQDREQAKQDSLKRKLRQEQNTAIILDILNKRHPTNLGSNQTVAEGIARFIEINFAKSDSELKKIIYDYLNLMLTVKKNE